MVSPLRTSPTEKTPRRLLLADAIAINLCGAGVLAAWLVAVPHAFTKTGLATLWVVAVLVIGIGLAELGHRLRR